MKPAPFIQSLAGHKLNVSLKALQVFDDPEQHCRGLLGDQCAFCLVAHTVKQGPAAPWRAAPEPPPALTDSGGTGLTLECASRPPLPAPFVMSLLPLSPCSATQGGGQEHRAIVSAAVGDT